MGVSVKVCLLFQETARSAYQSWSMRLDGMECIMHYYMQVSGDPRRPNECHKFKQLPPAAEDQTPAALLLFSVGFGMASLFLKV